MLSSPKDKVASGLTPDSVWSWLVSTGKESPKATLLTAALVWGGVIVLFHFFQVGYLPILDVSDLFGVVIAAAVMGVALVFVIAVPIVLPGYVLGELVKRGVGPRVHTRMAPDGTLKIKWKYRDIALLTSASAIASAAFLLFLTWLGASDILIAYMLLSAVVLLYAWAAIEGSDRAKTITGPSQSYWTFFLFQFFCYIFWWVFIALITDVWKEKGETDRLLNAVLLLLVSLFVHLLMVAAKTTSFPSRAAVLMMVLGYFLLVTGSLSVGGAKIVSYFDLGQVARVNLILTKTGCDTVNSAWSRRPCVGVSGGNPNSFVLPDVDLLTRVGSFYLVGERGAVTDLKNRRLIRISIRSEDVLGWSRVPSEAVPGE